MGSPQQNARINIYIYIYYIQIYIYVFIELVSQIVTSMCDR